MSFIPPARMGDYGRSFLSRGGGVAGLTEYGLPLMAAHAVICYLVHILYLGGGLRATDSSGGVPLENC